MKRAPLSFMHAETIKALARVAADGTDPNFERAYRKLCEEAAALDRLGVRPSWADPPEREPDEEAWLYE